MSHYFGSRAVFDLIKKCNAQPIILYLFTSKSSEMEPNVMYMQVFFLTSPICFVMTGVYLFSNI